MEDDIEDPVEAIFDAPMGAGAAGEDDGIGGQRRDVEVSGGFGLAVSFDLALDHGDA